MSLASPHAVAFAPPRSRLPQACPPPESGSVADAVRGEVVLDLALRHAGARRLPVRYELAGARGAPVVLVAGGISADRHAAASDTFDAPGWWDAQVGRGCAIDPATSASPVVISKIGNSGSSRSMTDLIAPIVPDSSAAPRNANVISSVGHWSAAA